MSKHRARPISGLIFIISGPSGSGKTTLLKNLLRVRGFKSKLARSVSFTTRPKRWGEKNGRDYFFISTKQFRQGFKEKRFLEWTRYLGYYYATSADFIERYLKKNKHVVLCLDLKGAARVKQLYPHNTITIFVRPASLDTLRHRIQGRSGDIATADINRRIRLAKKELSACSRYDYCVVNEDLESAVRELGRFILSKIKAQNV